MKASKADGEMGGRKGNREEEGKGKRIGKDD